MAVEAVYRRKKVKVYKYVPVNFNAFTDHALRLLDVSPSSRIFLVYALAARDDDNEVSMAELRKWCPVSVGSYYRIAKELEDHGYLRRYTREMNRTVFDLKPAIDKWQKTLTKSDEERKRRGLLDYRRKSMYGDEDDE